MKKHDDILPSNSHPADELNLSDYSNHLIEVTQKAAIASFAWLGKGDNTAADAAAVAAMRNHLNAANFKSQIVIGEGERDKAPMLYIGEQLGNNRDGNIELDIAVDPLEGTTICAHAAAGSLSVLAAGPADSLLHAPDVYMQKLAAPEYVNPDCLDLGASPKSNISNICKDLECSTDDIMVTVLNRPRHEQLIAELRAIGVRIRLISDGDIEAVLNIVMRDSEFVELYMGIGGAPEGVLAAAALKTLGAHFLGKLIFKDQQEREYAKQLGMKEEDLDKIYTIEDLIRKDALFIATGVSSGAMLSGVTKSGPEEYETQTLICNSATGRIDIINSILKSPL